MGAPKVYILLHFHATLAGHAQIKATHQALARKKAHGTAAASHDEIRVSPLGQTSAREARVHYGRRTARSLLPKIGTCSESALATGVSPPKSSTTTPSRSDECGPTTSTGASFCLASSPLKLYVRPPLSNISLMKKASTGFR